MGIENLIQVPEETKSGESSSRKPEAKNETMTLLADWHIYQLALFHLIHNALKNLKPKNNHQNDVTIQLNLIHDPILESNEVYLKTVVIDKGPGIDFEVLKQMNQPEESQDPLSLKNELNLHISTAKVLASA